MKYLILAEKPSALRSFSKDLGGDRGHFADFDYELVAAHGHLMTLDAPENQSDNLDFQDHVKHWSDTRAIPWPLERLKWQKTYGESKDRSGRKTTTRGDIARIRQAATGADAIVIATDNDPSGEGDVLGQEIIDAIRWRGRVYRLVFDDEHNAEEIKQALQNLVDVTDQSKSGAYQKGLARERFDWATMQLSRLATQAARNQRYDVLVRPGRLKSVIISKVYEQKRARDTFRPKPLYQAIFVDERGNKFTNKDMTKHEDQTMAENDVRQFQVSSIEVAQAKRKHQPAPKLYDLAQLGAVINNAKPKTFLDTYQKLYEAGLVSYPRTEDRAMTQSQWDQLAPLADDIAKMVGVDPRLLVNRQARPQYVSNKELVHGANRPGLVVPTSLDAVRTQFGPLGAQIYEVVAKSYLAAMGADYEYDVTTAFVANYPKFTAHKNVPVAPGYKQILGKLEAAAKDDDETPKEPEAEQFGKTATPQVNRSMTTKPTKPTRKFVLNYLTKENVGTGATRLSTLAGLMDGKRALLVEKRGELTLTEQGMVAGALMQNTMLARPDITKQLTQLMKQVGEFKIPLANIYKVVNVVIQKDRERMTQNAKQLNQDSYLRGKLPEQVTNSSVKVTVTLPDGKEVRFNRTFMGHTFTDEEVQRLAKGDTINIKVDHKGQAELLSGKLAHQQMKKGRETIKYWGFKPNWQTAQKV